MDKTQLLAIRKIHGRLWMENTSRAMHVTVRAHKGQLRKDGFTPYYIHPFRVAMDARAWLNSSFHDELDIAALWHDIFEDCGDDWRPVMLNTMDEMVGDIDKKMVFEIIQALTKNNSLKNRAEKNTDMIKRAIKGPKGTVLIKCCDRIDNLLDSEAFSAGFFKLYAKETAEMVDAFQEYMDNPTRAIYDDAILEEATDGAITNLNDVLADMCALRGIEVPS